MASAATSSPNISDSYCQLTLYHTDSSIPAMQLEGLPPIRKHLSEEKIVLIQQTAQEAIDAIARHFAKDGYFDVNKEWDKKLLRCIFLHNEHAPIDSFNFTRTDNPNITLTVSIWGPRGAIFKEPLETPYIPIEKEGSVSSHRCGSFGSSSSEYNYEQLKKINDNLVVALFNSESFGQLITSRSERVADEVYFTSRIVEKLDVAKE